MVIEKQVYYFISSSNTICKIEISSKSLIEFVMNTHKISYFSDHLRQLKLFSQQPASSEIEKYLTVIE